MESKKNSEFSVHQDMVMQELIYYKEELDIFGLNNENPTFDIQRYVDLKTFILMLSRNKRSVDMVEHLLAAIFVVSDADGLTDKNKLLDCIVQKFKLFELLSKVIRVTPQELLRCASSHICGKITFLLMLHGSTISVIDKFIGVQFYNHFILPKSWYYLISVHKLTYEKLKETILSTQFNSNTILISAIRDQLMHCIGKIALQHNLQSSQKKNLLQIMKNAFGFQNDQDMISFINGENGKGLYYETQLLQILMKKLSFGRRFQLEKLMIKGDQDKTLVFYDKKQYMQTDFYNKKGESVKKKIAQFKSALEFISKEFKKTNVTNSDFVIGFLEMFKIQFPTSLTDAKDSMTRQNKLIQYIMTVELLIKEQLVEDPYFRTAIIVMTIFVLKIGIEYQDTVEIAIFSMQLILNAIGLQQALPYLNKFCSLAVQAFIKFPEKLKIKKYTQKIINFYIKDKMKFTQAYFKDLQYLFLSKIKENEGFKEAINLISYELYKTPEDIAENLKNLVNQLQTGNEDIRLLNTTYILELLEQQEQDEVRKVLVLPENLKIVYQGILEMPQEYKTEKSRKLSLLCAKVVAAIGLCQPFVNDPLTLKATNQMTLIGRKKEFEVQNTSDEQNPSIIKSDYYNPLTNLKYKNQEQDNTLEYLAVPSLSELPIERKDIIKFAGQLLNQIQYISNITDLKPQQFYYTIFLIDKFINHHKMQQGLVEPNERDQLEQTISKQEHFAKTVFKFIGKDLTPVTEIDDPNSLSKKNYIKNLSLYLIHKIQDDTWKQLFIACIPALKISHKVLDLLLPYLIYYSLRFNQQDLSLPEDIGRLFNKIYDSNFSSQIAPTLKVQDFLKICLNQDKKIFKTFIENDTKFKYVEKLFHIEFDSSKIKDQNVLNFIKVIEGNIHVKLSFLAVKKIKALMCMIDKLKKINAAKTVKAYQRCIYSFEDHYRSQINQAGNQGKGFLDVLSHEETYDIINLNKQLNPEDYDYGIFNNIIESYNNNQEKHHNEESPMEVESNFIDLEAQRNKLIAQKIKKLFSNPLIINDWHNNDWEKLEVWASDVDLGELNHKIIMIDTEQGDPLQKFEMIICLFAAEYSKCLRSLLQNDDNLENPDYLSSLDKISKFFELLYCEFILTLDGIQGEISYYYKLFLHVIYELESAVHYIKDVFLQEKDKIQEILRKEVNREKRRFEKIYYEFDMNNYFEKLLSWFEERSMMIQNSTQSLKLIYYCRRMIFKLFDRENEYAFYLMKLAKIQRKTSNDILLISKLFKECESMQHRIVDYDLEYAKYMLKTKNAHEAYQYLIQKQDQIQKKCDEMYKTTKFQWMPQRVADKATLLSIELQIKIDPQNHNIQKRFDDFLKSIGKNQWEKPVFRFAQYLDELDLKNNSLQNPPSLDPTDARKRWIQKIFYYVNSLKYGYKYIWQSFPRALELWFEYNEKEKDYDKINNFMKQELSRLEVFKVASVLQILLSRYGHQIEQVRETIMLLLSKISIQYPGQCAWWIFHFLYFDQESGNTANAAAARRQQINQKHQAITRADFAKTLLGKIMGLDQAAYKKIVEGEKVFLELKKLSEKPPTQQSQVIMELPQFLQKISTCTLVMPIEENLSPQLPIQNFKINYVQTCLVQTTCPIKSLNRRNSAIHNHYSNFEQQALEEEEAAKNGIGSLQDFPAYKPKPVMISGFLNEATLMQSKEKPKKIGIIGSNKQVYNFLLKCDKFGDLRKEQRFIEFAQLCNKMLENDSESRKRNLKLRTNAIVPLSRNSGLIEWIQNTSTLKSVVGDYWKKNNIKGEMNEIKNKATAMKNGDTHTLIWNAVKEDIKPVLGSWMIDHFPNPEIWYEARINFVRSTAIWSMIGYVIGLGDRHGDNILIHHHTGEVTHVDFDCIFEKGAKLKIPEIVPFRLTQNIMDAFGIFKEKGIFQRTCEVVQRVLRKNSKNIISFLESFIHDPLIESTQNIKVEIKQALDVVKQKLHGQIKGDQGGSVNIEEQVEFVILQAINDESLAKMYIGWMPWL